MVSSVDLWIVNERKWEESPNMNVDHIAEDTEVFKDLFHFSDTQPPNSEGLQGRGGVLKVANH